MTTEQVRREIAEGDGMTDGLLVVDSGFACFGVVVARGIVVRAAPIAKWCVGRRVGDVTAYWRRRGATVDERIEVSA